MSYTSITIIPRQGEDRIVEITATLNNEYQMAALDLGTLRIQFRPTEPDYAIEYLAKLAAEATALVQMITEAQS